jgi:prophage regulatory protein
MEQKVLSINEAVIMTGLSKSTIFRLEDDSQFPARVQLSQRRIGWLRKDIEKWLECIRPSSEGGQLTLWGTENVPS